MGPTACCCPHAHALVGAEDGTFARAVLVVRPEIHGPTDLRGRRVASPQLGNTQDVSLRRWLRAQGLADRGPGAVALLELVDQVLGAPPRSRGGTRGPCRMGGVT